MQRLTLRKIVLLVSLGWVVAAITLWTSSAVPASAYRPFDPELHASAPKAAPSSPAAAQEARAVPKRQTPIPKVRTSNATARTAGRSASTSKSYARTAVRTSSTSEIQQARSLLAAQIAKHPILRGTTVTFGNAQGYQAISYYQSGEIILSRTHTASLSRIIAHEVWHIIDWRDNGRIDWGENVPR